MKDNEIKVPKRLVPTTCRWLRNVRKILKLNKKLGHTDSHLITKFCFTISSCTKYRRQMF